MAIATLSAIITKIRRLSATPNSNQLTDSQILDYINSFYLYDFPAEFRALDLKGIYTFNTIRGLDTYPFDMDHWVNVQEPCWIAKQNAKLFQDPFAFYQYNFYSNSAWQQDELLTTGTGIAGPYIGTLQNTPIIRSVNNNPMVNTQTANTGIFPAGYPPTFATGHNISRIQNLIITANLGLGNTQNITDDGAGNLIDQAGTATGTINYNTGAISVTFSNAVPSGQEIRVAYCPVVLNTPVAILFWQNQFVLRPVPDKGYIVELTAYRLPSQLLLGSGSTVNFNGRPEELEWWETISVGAARKIYEDRLDVEGISTMDKMLQERYQANYTRTYANLGKQRIGTLFSDQLGYTVGSPYGGNAL